jgi:hypothetical protein
MIFNKPACFSHLTLEGAGCKEGRDDSHDCSQNTLKKNSCSFFPPLKIDGSNANRKCRKTLKGNLKHRLTGCYLNLLINEFHTNTKCFCHIAKG